MPHVLRTSARLKSGMSVSIHALNSQKWSPGPRVLPWGCSEGGDSQASASLGLLIIQGCLFGENMSKPLFERLENYVLNWNPDLMVIPHRGKRFRRGLDGGTYP